ncbi:MAG: hypothetical protein PWR30_183 [Candidatus Woesearchaeota archaeon]|nr:hypothetical protein [Candidatus Woesearchaeota archaeon]
MSGGSKEDKNIGNFKGMDERLMKLYNEELLKNNKTSMNSDFGLERDRFEKINEMNEEEGILEREEEDEKSLDELLREADELDKKYQTTSKKSKSQIATLPRNFSFEYSYSKFKNGLEQVEAIQEELNKKYLAESSTIGKIGYFTKKGIYKILGKDFSEYTEEQLIEKEMSGLRTCIDGGNELLKETEYLIDRNLLRLNKMFEEKNKLEEEQQKYRNERIERQTIGKQLYKSLKELTASENSKAAPIKEKLMMFDNRISELDSLIVQTEKRIDARTRQINELKNSNELIMKYKDLLTDTVNSAKDAYEDCETLRPTFKSIDHGSKVANLTKDNVEKLSDTFSLLWKKALNSMDALYKIAETSKNKDIYDNSVLTRINEINDVFKRKKYDTFEDVERRLESSADDIEYTNFKDEDEYL